MHLKKILMGLILVAMLAFSVSAAAPKVHNFDANPHIGFGSLMTHFTFKVSDSDGDDLSCQLEFGDGHQTEWASCESLNGQEHHYKGEGKYWVFLRVSDGQKVINRETSVFITDKYNHLPVVETFGAHNAKNSKDVTFKVKVTDVDMDDLTCILVFGDGKAKWDVPCEDLDGHTHTYPELNKYYWVSLYVMDGRYTKLHHAFGVTPGNGKWNAAPRKTYGTTITEWSGKKPEASNGQELDFSNCEGYDCVGGFDKRNRDTSVKTLPYVQYDIDTLYKNGKFSTYHWNKVWWQTKDRRYCSLIFGDGDREDEECSDLHGELHTYKVGEYTSILGAKNMLGSKSVAYDLKFYYKDGKKVLVKQGLLQKPTSKDLRIKILDARAKYEENDKLGVYFVLGLDGLYRGERTCTIDFGDGTSRTKDCKYITGTIHKYKEGFYKVKVTAEDDKQTTNKYFWIRVYKQYHKDSTELKMTKIYYNTNPNINWLTGKSKIENGKANVNFYHGVWDHERTKTNCYYDFGDGTKSPTKECHKLSGIPHTYNKPGTYMVTLHAEDSWGDIDGKGKNGKSMAKLEIKVYWKNGKLVCDIRPIHAW